MRALQHRKYENQSVMPMVLLAIMLGVVLGLSHWLGPLVAGLIMVAMVGLVSCIMAKKLYHHGVLLIVVLLSCVLIEPSPSDILFCALLVVGIILGKIKLDKVQKILPVLALFFAYQTYCMLTLLGASDLMDSARYYLITLYLSMFAAFIAIYTQREHVISIQRAYIISAFLSFAAGLLGYLGILPQLFMADAYRVKGLFKDPNVFGPFFVPAIVMLLDDCRHRRLLKHKRWVHAVLILCFSLGTLFSFSRAAWICWFASIALYGALNVSIIYHSKLFKRLATSAVVIIVILAVLWSFTLAESDVGQFISSRAQIKSYDTARFSAQRSGFSLFLDNPWGCGPGQYENEVMRIMTFGLSAHSLYVRLLAENGLIGFVLFILAFIGIIVLLYIQHRRESVLKDKRDIGITPSVLISALCGYLIVSLVVDTLHWRHLWFVLGLGLYSIKYMEG